MGGGGNEGGARKQRKLERTTQPSYTDATGSGCDGCCRPLVQTYEQAGYHYLEVCNVTANDSGMYVGTVQNSAGTDTASAELDVFGECMESRSLALTVS